MRLDLNTPDRDPFALQRFVDAQEPVYEQVLDELRGGRKRTHWMWFIFPQIAGLGRSATSMRFAISSLLEATKYLAHPVLGPRLEECSALVLGVEDRSIEAILGQPDDVKFRSSMTLFVRADPHRPVFQACLDKYFGGELDPATLARLWGERSAP